MKPNSIYIVRTPIDTVLTCWFAGLIGGWYVFSQATHGVFYLICIFGLLAAALITVKRYLYGSQIILGETRMELIRPFVKEQIVDFGKVEGYFFRYEDHKSWIVFVLKTGRTLSFRTDSVDRYEDFFKHISTKLQATEPGRVPRLLIEKILYAFIAICLGSCFMTEDHYVRILLFCFAAWSVAIAMTVSYFK